MYWMQCLCLSVVCTACRMYAAGGVFKGVLQRVLWSAFYVKMELLQTEVQECFM